MPETDNMTALLDCYDGDPELLPAAEATRRIDSMIQPITEVESVPIREALERILAEEVISPFNVPGHKNSAMDGFAVTGASLPRDVPKSFDLVGTAWAGKPFAGEVGAHATVRIMTGAVMPSGTDTVVMQEHVEVHGDRVTITPGHKSGQNVREAGEDIATGATVLRPGTRLMPAELGLLASLGIASVGVRRRLKVAFFSTGDELRSIGDSIAPGEVYDSNRYILYGMLSRLGADIIDLGVVRDQPQATRDAFLEASQNADVVISSGGASTGEADYIKRTLDELGSVGFWRIAIRPGRPLAFGRVGDALFFGLPGNPVAVMVTFYQFVQPALRKIAGAQSTAAPPLLQARTDSRLRKKPGRVEYYRATLSRDTAGELWVRHTGKTGSGLLHTMSDANCFIVLPEASESVEAGTMVDVQPFFGLV